MSPRQVTHLPPVWHLLPPLAPGRWDQWLLVSLSKDTNKIATVFNQQQMELIDSPVLHHTSTVPRLWLQIPRLDDDDQQKLLQQNVSSSTNMADNRLF